MESKKFLTTDEVAAEFGLDAAALQVFVDSGDVRALADRGTWKYRRDELQGLVDAGKIHPLLEEPLTGDSAGSMDQVLHLGEPDDDDLSYIELDEDALAEQATMISKSRPVDTDSPVDAEPDSENWFVPSDSAEMKMPASEVEQSSSDVTVYSGPGVGEGASVVEDSELTPVASSSDSDSDVRIADYTAPRPEDSGILLDFNLDAGATVSSSGSSLRLPQTVPDSVPDVPEPESEDAVWEGAEEEIGTGGSSVGRTSDTDSGISLVGDDDDSVDLDDGSGIQLMDVEESGVRLAAEESGIILDEGSAVGMPAVEGSSVLAGSGMLAAKGDSDMSLEDLEAVGSSVLGGSGMLAADDDSGMTLNDSESGISLEKEDDGITLASEESGIMLAGDSGLSLEAADSGLSLEAADSGLSLEGADSGISIEAGAKTLADDDLDVTAMFADDEDDGRTRTLAASEGMDDDSSLDLDLAGNDVTAEFLFDEEDADDTSATVVRKGRKSAPQPGGLSAAFELDEPAEVEDLEISEDLDSGVEDEVEDFAAEEVFDASDETFSGDEVEATGDEDEDYLEPAAKKKATGPREPAWGAGMVAGLVACSLFLGANALIVWAGVSTMWSGADAEGPAASLITSLADLIQQ